VLKCLQRCLSDETKGLKSVTILSWSTSYDVKPDGILLTDASCKKYVEDLLVAIRHGLQRRHLESSSSAFNPAGTSTPQREKLTSIDEEDTR
jgi:hypothetical protein